jgi:hypothetical protein
MAPFTGWEAPLASMISAVSVTAPPGMTPPATTTELPRSAHEKSVRASRSEPTSTTVTLPELVSAVPAGPFEAPLPFPEQPATASTANMVAIFVFTACLLLRAAFQRKGLANPWKARRAELFEECVAEEVCSRGDASAQGLHRSPDRETHVE